MESISRVNLRNLTIDDPISTIIGWLVIFSSFLVILSGTTICYEIRKQETSDRISIAPFLTGIMNGALWWNYGELVMDNISIIISKLQVFLYTVYTVTYFAYSSEKSLVFLKILEIIMMTFFLISLSRTFEETFYRENIAGFIANLVNIIFLASPLAAMGEVIRSKTTENFPFPMILFGTFSSVMFLVYGYLIEDWHVMINGAVTSIICSSELSLFLIYPGNSKRNITDI